MTTKNYMTASDYNILYTAVCVMDESVTGLNAPARSMLLNKLCRDLSLSVYETYSFGRETGLPLYEDWDLHEPTTTLSARELGVLEKVLTFGLQGKPTAKGRELLLAMLDRVELTQAAMHEENAA